MKLKHILFFFCIVLLTSTLIAGCGSKGGAGTGDGTDTGDIDEPSIPSPTYNFTGTVYKRTGTPVYGATVTALNGTSSDYLKDVTQSNGQFAMNLEDRVYTVIASKAGYIDTVRRVDRSGGGTKELSMLLSEGGLEKKTENIRASAGGAIELDASEAAMQIQNSSTINVGTDRNLSSQDITVELIDLSHPLPVPLPSSETLDEVVVGGKQTPSILLQIRPTLLELNPSATLTMPNPDELTNVRVLHFDPFAQKWSEVGKTNSQPSKLATVDVTKGGVYGIFFEDENQQKRVSVSGTAEKGATVFVGDEVVKASVVDGSFYVASVSVPKNGMLEIVGIAEDPENEGYLILDKKSVTVTLDETEIIVDLTETIIFSIQLSASKDALLANGKDVATISVEVLQRQETEEDFFPVEDNTDVKFAATMGTLSKDVVKTLDGKTQVKLTSSTDTGIAQVTAEAAGVAESISISFRNITTIAGRCFSASGTSVSQAHIDSIRKIEDMDQALTDAEGRFNVEAPLEWHTVIASKAGYINAFRVVDVDAEINVEQTMMLMESASTSKSVLAQSGGNITSNAISEKTASLTVNIQGADGFSVGEETRLSNVDISLEYIDLTGPLPAELPSPDILNPNDVKIGGKQTPSAMVSIKPALLEMDVPAQLTLPNPANLSDAKILHFDPYEHRWTSVGSINNVPVSISSGGLYGIFFEDEERLGAVRGKGTPGAKVFVGDEVATISSDGKFYISDVPVAYETDAAGKLVPTPIDIVAINPDGTTVAQRIDLAPGEVTTADLTDVEVSEITVTSDKGVLIAGGEDSTTITAEVLKSEGEFVEDGVSVRFQASAGTLSDSYATTLNGKASVDLKGPAGSMTALTVSATVGGKSAMVTLEVISQPGSFAVSLSKTFVLTDNSDSSTIMATVLDTNFVPVENIEVKFDADGGQISSNTAMTNSDGEAQIEFKAGNVDKANAIRYVEAYIGEKPQMDSTNGADFRQISVAEDNSSSITLWQRIPIQVKGTTLSMTAENTTLDLGDDNEKKTKVIIDAKDAGGTPIFNTPINLTYDPTHLELTLPKKESEGNPPDTQDSVSISGETDVNGQLIFTVTAKKATTANNAIILTADGLGTSAELAFTINAAGEEVFRIIEPTPLNDNTFVTLKTNESLHIVVNVPVDANGNKVTEQVDFYTTFGKWDENGKKVYRDSTLTAHQTDTGIIYRAEAYLLASEDQNGNKESGVATVQVTNVFDSDDPKPLLSDTLEVRMFAPAEEAEQISIQPSANIISPSTSEIENSVELSVVVKNQSGQPVGDASVVFSLSRSTGGGERIWPTMIKTNETGRATANFIAGTLSSEAEGVQVTATVLKDGEVSDVSDTASIVIGGTAASVIIGQSTKIESVAADTAYELTMSVLVSDANGNPVTHQDVTMSTWASRYATGGWVPCPEGQQGCCISRLDLIKNEDSNKNLTLDPGEDGDENGELTPPSTAAGAISPAIVTTDETGMAEFKLTYVKESAGWIEDKIIARTRVSGSETVSSYTFWLPWAGEDSNDCVLPHSPYNRLREPAKMNASADPFRLTADGADQSVIQAIVLDKDGNTVTDGTGIEFKLVPPSDPDANWGGFPTATHTRAYTVNGIATVIYQAGDQEANQTNPLKIMVTASDSLQKELIILLSKGTLNLSATTYELLAIPTEQSVITARLTDVNGEPFERNMEVIFEIPADMPGVFLQNGEKTYSAYSLGGIAQVTYQAERIDESQSVVISARTVEDAMQDDITISLKTEAVSSVNLRLEDEGAEPILAADGKSAINLVADIQNNNGEPMSEGNPVTFTLSPTEMGARFTNGGTAFTAFTSVSGEASASLIAGTAPGVVTVTATSGGISDSLAIQLRGQAAGSNVAMAITGQAPEYTITLNARDAKGNPVADGTGVSFSATEGILTPKEETTEGGVATTILNVSTAASDQIAVTAVMTGGPRTHITSLAAIPADQALEEYIIYAGTSGGGVYRSLDSGNKWENISLSDTEMDQNWIHPYVNDINVDLDNLNIVYAGTNGYGDQPQELFRSVDGGLTWESVIVRIDNGDEVRSFGSSVTAVLTDYIADSNPNTNAPYIWVGTKTKGIYSSTGEQSVEVDGKTVQSFEFVPNTVVGQGKEVRDLVRVLKTTGGSAVLYAATSNGVYRRADRDNDGKFTWGQTATFLGNSITSLALYPGETGFGVSDTLYAGTRDAGVWWTDDSGDIWDPVTEDGMAEGAIKDLFIDEGRKLLYALALDNAPLFPNGKGNVYVKQMNYDGSAGDLPWRRVSDGLPNYNPPGTISAVGLHAIEAMYNNDGQVSGLMVGGELTSVFVAESGFDILNPSWEEHAVGLENNVMGRVIIDLNNGLKKRMGTVVVHLTR